MGRRERDRRDVQRRLAVAINEPKRIQSSRADGASFVRHLRISSTDEMRCRLLSMISVVVPIYNAGEKLQRCIQSIRNQTFHNWSLLLINDGSCDDSLLLCMQAADQDSRIRLFAAEVGEHRRQEEGSGPVEFSLHLIRGCGRLDRHTHAGEALGRCPSC